MKSSYKAITINLISSTIFLATTYSIGHFFSIFHFWFFLSVGFILIASLLIINQNKIKERNLVLKIFQEVSASKCNDFFIKYAYKLFNREKIDYQNLNKLLTYRKHPNLSTFNTIQHLIDNNINFHEIEKYLKMLPHHKKLLRYNVIINVANFLKCIEENSILVLYGFSSTVCDSIVDIGNLIKNPIILIEDLQYGIDNSLGEHKIAEQYLKDKGLKPYIINFDKIPDLLKDETNFVKSINRNRLTLSNIRTLYAIIGCEAYDLNGNAFIPSTSSGQSSETAKFIEVFTRHQKESVSGVKGRIVVITESNKIYTKIKKEDLSTFAPMKINFFQKLLFLLFNINLLKGNKVELCKINSDDIYMIIDDNQAYYNKDKFDFSNSLIKWRKQTIDNIFTGKKITMTDIINLCDVFIFDFDGVVANMEYYHFISFAELCLLNHTNLNFNEYEEYCFGYTEKSGIINLLKNKKIEGNVDELVKTKENIFYSLIYNASPEKLIYMEGIEIINFLHNLKKELYLVTSSSHEMIKRIDKNKLINKYFKKNNQHFEYESDKRYALIVEIYNNHKVKANCVIIDDSPKNINYCKKQGLQTIAIGGNHANYEYDSDLFFPNTLSLAEEIRKIYI
jgi:beta-phosphoglucomutase-like phosphatase (HAD superfamily)